MLNNRVQVLEQKRMDWCRTNVARTGCRILCIDCANMAWRHVPAHLTTAVRDYHRLPPLRRHLVASWPLTFLPGYVALSEAGEVFATDWKTHTVHVVTLNGTFVRQWGSRGNAAGQFEQPIGIAVTRAGEVVVCDLGNSRVQVFRTDGTFVRMWGSKGSGDGQFDWPRGVAVTPNGEVLVTDQKNCRVQVFRLSDGTFLRVFGALGTAGGQLRDPSGICMAPNGSEVVIADSGNRRVQVFRTDGTFVRIWASYTSRSMGYPSTVLVRGDELLVVDVPLHHLQLFGRTGTLLRLWDTFDSKNKYMDTFRSPSGLLLTQRGQVIITDDKRMQMFE